MSKLSAQKLKRRIQQLETNPCRLSLEQGWQPVTFYPYVNRGVVPQDEKRRRQISRALNVDPGYLWDDQIPLDEAPPPYSHAVWGNNPTNFRGDFQSILEQAIRDSGLSYRALTQKARISVNTLKRYRTEATSGDPITLMRLAGALGLSWRYFTTEGARREDYLAGSLSPVSESAVVVEEAPSRESNADAENLRSQMDRIEEKLDLMNRNLGRILENLGNFPEESESPEPSYRNGDDSFLQTHTYLY